MIQYLLSYKLFLVPLLVASLIQCCKLCIDVFLGKKALSFHSLWVAGGFPSVHSGLASSLVTIMGLEYGFGSAYFAIAFCFACLFRYDAANVRYQAGQHAQYLNYMYKLLQNLEKLGIHEKHLEHLKERLGHTVTEVLGGILFGCLITVFLWIQLHHLG